MCFCCRPNRCFPASLPRHAASFQPWPPRSAAPGVCRQGRGLHTLSPAARRGTPQCLPPRRGLARRGLARSRGMSGEGRWPEVRPPGRQATARWGEAPSRGAPPPESPRFSLGRRRVRGAADAGRGRRAQPPLCLSPQPRGASGRGRRRRPPLPPPPRCPAPSLRRAAGCAGRERGRKVLLEGEV